MHCLYLVISFHLNFRISSMKFETFLLSTCPDQCPVSLKWEPTMMASAATKSLMLFIVTPDPIITGSFVTFCTAKKKGERNVKF